MSIVERFVSFTQSAWLESKKVTWPSRSELKESTIVVIVATFIIMIYLFIVDRALSLALSLFVR
jgi:preprotein translocase subunit SecE